MEGIPSGASSCQRHYCPTLLNVTLTLSSACHFVALSTRRNVKQKKRVMMQKVALFEV